MCSFFDPAIETILNQVAAVLQIASSITSDRQPNCIATPAIFFPNTPVGVIIIDIQIRNCSDQRRRRRRGDSEAKQKIHVDNLLFVSAATGAAATVR